jgi:hypothetical protein
MSIPKNDEYDPADDEQLALELLFGVPPIVKDRRSGIHHGRSEYPKGKREQDAVRALCRLLAHTLWGPGRYSESRGLADMALHAFLVALNPDGDGIRRFAPGFRKRGKHPDISYDLQIYFYVREQGGNDAAVAAAEAKFNISRTSVYDAVKRVKNYYRERGISIG